MAAPAPSPRTLLLLLLLLLLLPPPPGAHGELCRLVDEDNMIPESCPDFCCGSCSSQYCCSDVQKRVQWDEDTCTAPEGSRFSTHPETLEQLGSALRFRSSFDSDPMSGFGATVAIGVTIFVVFIATIIICFTCSCCCLYKMCCDRPRPVVTNTTTTTVVHTPYPQPPSVAPSYPGPTYQGYHPMPPQPGMPTAPYPTQYPPPYLAQPGGPPAYHESLAGGPAAPYSASQPPYNPAYMDPPKAMP
ncbi:protein shisa-5 isoform X1 [Onychomys torridus]|uniref:protein shisa-5 isoform X1 n=1 Tax=Onychomys torridus TaxID=38674 RepID=UPI00167FAB46|nr:protein shisa-5 isoform X1 [Onychomys torridus]